MHPATTTCMNPFNLLCDEELKTGLLESCENIYKHMSIKEIGIRTFRAACLSATYIPTIYPAMKYLFPAILNTIYILPIDLVESALGQPIQDFGYRDTVSSVIQIASFSINLLGFGSYAYAWFRKELIGAINWAEMMSLSEQKSPNSDKPVALICIAKMDLQGAITRISRAYLEEIEKISECNEIVIVRVGETEDINSTKKSLLENGKKIDLIISAAHGNEDDGISLGWDGQKINTINASNLDLNGLEENASICLFSCYAGKERSIGIDNIAQKIQNVAGKSITVYAPKEAATQTHFASRKGFEFINQDGKKSFKFYNSLGEDITFIGKKE